MWSTTFRTDVWWFFQTVSTPSKRRQTSSPAGSVTLSPLKKLKTVQEVAEDGCSRRLLRLRPQTPSQPSEVRTSPRKSGPPNTPARQPRVAPRRKESPARQIKEGGAKATQEVLPAVKNRETQVMMIKPIKQYRLVKNTKVWWIKRCCADCLNSPFCSGASEACPRPAVSQQTGQLWWFLHPAVVLLLPATGELSWYWPILIPMASWPQIRCQMKWTECVFRRSGGDVRGRHSLPDRLRVWDGDEEIQSCWRGLLFFCLTQVEFTASSENQIKPNHYIKINVFDIDMESKLAVKCGLWRLSLHKHQVLECPCLLSGRTDVLSMLSRFHVHLELCKYVVLLGLIWLHRYFSQRLGF